MGHFSKINPAKLHALTNRPGTLHHISQKEPGGSLMQGEFSLAQQVSGIWIHVNRVLELQDATSTFELPPGLSFTFVFEGEAKFSMANREHSFKACDNSKKIECSAICIAQDEIISRKIYKGESVYKLNISIDKANLESRCKSTEDHLEINQLFAIHGAIYQWQVSAKLRKLIVNLMTIINKESVLQRLHIESYTTEILFHVLSRLQQECAKAATSDKQQALKPNAIKSSVIRSNLISKENYAETKDLRERIDSLLHQTLELEDIAQQLNMSVSTLQRKFKKTCGSTVIEYLRRKRLQQARNEMISAGISLTEAASLAGYKHPANFVTAFKKAFSTTPYAYCKELGY